MVSSTTKTGRHDIAESGDKHQKFKIQIHSSQKEWPYKRGITVLLKIALNNIDVPHN